MRFFFFIGKKERKEKERGGRRRKGFRDEVWRDIWNGSRRGGEESW